MSDIKDLPAVAGWKPPIVYDITTDAYRIVTQDDVDRWKHIETVYGKMVQYLRSEHTELLARIKRKNDDA